MLWLSAAGVCMAERATASVIAGVWEASGTDVAPNVIAWGCEGCGDAGTGFADICMGSLGTLEVLKPKA